MKDNRKEDKAGLLGNPAEISALVHFYRALVTRSNTWRRIVDNTTNWAVAATAAIFSFGFSGGEAGGGRGAGGVPGRFLGGAGPARAGGK